MGKRKADDSGEHQVKKNKKFSKNEGNSKDNKHRKQNKDFNRNNKNHSNDNKGNKRFKNKKNEKTKVKEVRKPQSMQEILSEKLRKIQEKKLAENASKADDTLTSNSNQDIPSSELNTSVIELDQNVDVKSKTEDKPSMVSNNDSVANDGDEEEEEDPEKAAMRLKKREKRKQKKLEKEQVKQMNKEKAGTAKLSAIEYLNHWKEKKEDWKFSKVRQVWLLHNMYDSELLKDEEFEILLSYLEGLKGKSREVTVTEAEQIIEKADNEEEEDEPSATMMERARQIIQLLSC